MIHLTGGEALARALQPEDVPFAFGIVGGKIAPFLKGLSQQESIRYVGVRHEAAGALMAAAVYASTGRIAVAFSELGPGTVNVVAGVASAFNNHLPLLLITSNNQHATSYPSSGQMMELDTQALLKPITKWNAVVHDGRRIPQLVRWAFREALTGRRGPVHLDVPQDILQQTFAFEEEEFAWKPSEYRAMEVGPPASQIEAAAEMLSNAERPLLIAGGGVVRSMSEEAFRRIAEYLDAPATATQMGLGAVSTASAGFIGHGGVIGGEAVVRAMEEADVVLAVGCRFSSWLWNEKGPIVRLGQKVIQVDVDPGAIGRLVPVQFGLLGDAANVLPELFQAIKQRSNPRKGRGWTAAISEAYRAYRTRFEELAGERADIMHPAALAAEIGRLLPDNALVTYDGGHTSFWSNDFTPATEPRTRFHEPAMAQLGFGLPYAIALSLAHPQSSVFNITGDGSFGFTLQELDTARRYGAPVITIIHNNAAWGVIGLGQKKMGFDLGADLSGTDYAAIARGFGIHGELVTELAHLRPAIGRSLASGLPAVIDCRTRFVPHPMMPAFGRTASVGMLPAAGVTR